MSTGSRELFTQPLLLAAYRSTVDELLDELARSGHGAIRHKHGALFANLDEAGTRPSALADRAGMSKPAMGELIDELQRLGYVRRLPDPADGRAKVVVPTAAAKEVMELVVRVNRGIERRYRRLLGDAAYEAFRSALLAIVPDERVQPQPRMRPGSAGLGRGRGRDGTSRDGG